MVQISVDSVVVFFCSFIHFVSSCNYLNIVISKSYLLRSFVNSQILVVLSRCVEFFLG
jgi:hypothetical protein